MKLVELQEVSPHYKLTEAIITQHGRSRRMAFSSHLTGQGSFLDSNQAFIGLEGILSSSHKVSLLAARVELGLAFFNSIDQRALRLRYGFDADETRTLQQISTELGFSRSGITARMNSVTGRFPHKPKSWSFFKFLLIPEFDLPSETRKYLEMLIGNRYSY